MAQARIFEKTRPIPTRVRNYILHRRRFSPSYFDAFSSEVHVAVTTKSDVDVILKYLFEMSNYGDQLYLTFRDVLWYPYVVQQNLGPHVAKDLRKWFRDLAGTIESFKTAIKKIPKLQTEELQSLLQRRYENEPPFHEETRQLVRMHIQYHVVPDFEFEIDLSDRQWQLTAFSELQKNDLGMTPPRLPVFLPTHSFGDCCEYDERQERVQLQEQVDSFVEELLYLPFNDVRYKQWGLRYPPEHPSHGDHKLITQQFVQECMQRADLVDELVKNRKGKEQVAREAKAQKDRMEKDARTKKEEEEEERVGTPPPGNCDEKGCESSDINRLPSINQRMRRLFLQVPRFHILPHHFRHRIRSSAAQTVSDLVQPEHPNSKETPIPPPPFSSLLETNWGGDLVTGHLTEAQVHAAMDSLANNMLQNLHINRPNVLREMRERQTRFHDQIMVNRDFAEIQEASSL